MKFVVSRVSGDENQRLFIRQVLTPRNNKRHACHKGFRVCLAYPYHCMFSIGSLNNDPYTYTVNEEDVRVF